MEEPASTGAAGELCGKVLYIVAEEGLFAAHELPDGWGLLVRRGAELVIAVKPSLRDTTPAERVALIERIAAVAARERQPRD